MNVTKDESQVSLSQNFTFARTNSGIACMSMVLNFLVIVGFLAAKKLRENPFYRLLIPLTLVHLIGSTSGFGYTIVILTYSEKVKYVCVLIFTVNMSCTALSFVQTVILSLDRYQSTLPLPTSVILNRRKILGYIDATVWLILILFMVVITGTTIGDGDCYALQSFHSRPEMNVFGSLIILVTLLIDILFCILTFLNIRKQSHAVGTRVSSTSIRTNQNREGQISTSNFPTTTMQYKMKNKRHALNVICFLIVTHGVTAVSRMFILVSIKSDPSTVNSVRDVFLVLQLITYVLDSVFCIISIRPLREIFTCNAV
ncbi:Hypothetical predicted protein [Mytilus galloprovincialis]|uniref:G-protein coupled receptors family 1 profile domain-containing protein n=1 Tax=Mytilus galloprovincialis TaxID=29158 RepID=A0A8B6CD95_MYTGA|nr:Hypothetical predicted protein [Mytilus galloprovincialis]